MKKILLTSAGIRVKVIKNEILKILSKSPSDTKIAYITTAVNYKEYDAKRDKDFKPLKKLGFQIFSYDIAGKKETGIKEFLRGKDIIYVRGGNTFYLLKHIKKSGFDKIVKNLVKKGVIYIGVSAGSYVACPTIEMANWKYPPDNNIVNLKNLTAMNLAPFLITVHYKPEFKEAIKKEVKKSKYPVKILTDEQAILIKGDKIKLVGGGKEIKI